MALTFKKAIEEMRDGAEHAPVRDRLVPVKGSKGDPSVTLRTDQARTGDPIIDALLEMEPTHSIINSAVVDRSYTIPYGAGGSMPLEDPTTFIDEHVPESITVSGVTFDPAEPWVIHENVEQPIMMILINAGFSDDDAYSYAHWKVAEVAEGAWYKFHGIDQAEAERQEATWLRQIEVENATDVPGTLYTAPYGQAGVAGAKYEPEEEPKPSAELVARARAVLLPLFTDEPAPTQEPVGKAEEMREVLYDFIMSKLSPEAAAALAPEVAAKRARDMLERLAKKPTLSKAEAGYVFPAPGPNFCAGCSMFQPPQACTLVKAEDDGIQPAGTCDHFDAKVSKVEPSRVDMRTLYVHRDLLNADDVIKWAKENGFATTVPADEMHVTVAYSRAEVNRSALEPRTEKLSVTRGYRSLAHLGENGDAVVLKFASAELQDQWRGFLAAGASWDWPEYQPHVTLTYNGDMLDLDKIEPYAGPLEFGPEVFGEVVANWQDKIVEKREMELTRAAVLKYLSQHAPDIAALVLKSQMCDECGCADGKHLEKCSQFGKSQPGAADVHATTALGNQKGKGKARNFLSTITDVKVKEGNVDATKRDVEWKIPLDIVKTTLDQQLIFGWASVAEIGGKLVIDKQNDMILPEDLEKAAYDFVKWTQEADVPSVLKFIDRVGLSRLRDEVVLIGKSRGYGDMHEKQGVGMLIESMVFTKQKQDVLGIDLGLQGWWVGFHVTDEQLWKDIKAGKRPEFSIGGKAVRVPV